MFDDWCDIDETARGERKKLCGLTEKAGGRAAIKDELIERVRSHYDELEQIADDVERLGFRVPVVLQELCVNGFVLIDLSLKLIEIGKRLRYANGHVVEGALWPEQRCERHAFKAAAARELNGGKQRSARG